jgi:[ribosomal protein S5]-alanine N-acetyltransferase
MSKQKTLSTERLLLRPFNSRDAGLVESLVNDELIYKTTLHIPYPYTIAMARAWIASHESVYLDLKGFCYACCLKNTGTLIGAISVTRPPKSSTGELGYWIGVDYWNQGYCTEAAQAIIRHAFTDQSFHKICGRHFKENVSSGRVLVKCGMNREGELVDELMKDGTYKTIITYGIINSSSTLSDYRE